MKTLKNPFVLAFVFGLVFLTALPFMQKRFLSAPKPLGAFGPWVLTSLDGGTEVKSEALLGHVLLATFAPNPCQATCRDRTAALGRTLEHTDDLGDRVHLLTVAAPGAEGELEGREGPRWHVVTGSPEALTPLFSNVREAWGAFAGTDAGTTVDELSALPAYVVVDPKGQIRGFWRDDAAGRGNAINAARLLARHDL